MASAVKEVEPKETEPKEDEPKEVEDTTPRDTLPDASQLPEEKPKVGWQTDPIPAKELKIPCPHIGRTIAALQVELYPLGAEWVCTCGQIFVVAVNKGGKRTLRKQEDVAVDGLNAEASPESDSV